MPSKDFWVFVSRNQFRCIGAEPRAQREAPAAEQSRLIVQ